MKRIRNIAIIFFAIFCLSSIGIGAYSTNDKVAKMYRDPSVTYRRWLKMQITYKYSVTEVLFGQDNAAMEIHLGDHKYAQYYDYVSSSYRNNQSVEYDAVTKDANWKDYYTYRYYAYYRDRGTTYNVTIRAALDYSYIDNTYSTCTYFYADTDEDDKTKPQYDGSFSVKIQNSDTLKPSDYDKIR
jgi:hypothetical protein